MKKLIYIIVLLLFCVNNSYALSVVKVSSLTNKCSLVEDNKIVVKVFVFALNDGTLSKMIDTYTLGRIYNNDKLSISSISGDISSIKIDDRKDSNNMSNVYYSIDKDLDVKKLNQFISFYITYEFDKVPDSINVLGNEVIINNDKEVCEKINEGNIVVNNMKDIEIEKVHNHYYLYDIIGGLLIVILFIIFIKRR